MHLFTTECLDVAEDKKVCKLSKRKQLFQGNILKCGFQYSLGDTI